MSDRRKPEEVRARLVAELLGERRRLERALHDGVQQDLTALAVELQLASLDPERLAELRRHVHGALDAVRSLAERVYPPLLDANGLAAALPGEARRAGRRLLLDAAGAPRASPDVEAAILFACRAAFEAAPEAAAVSVSLSGSAGRLRVELEPAALTRLGRDLVEGVGGSAAVDGGRVVLVV